MITVHVFVVLRHDLRRETGPKAYTEGRARNFLKSQSLYRGGEQYMTTRTSFDRGFSRLSLRASIGGGREILE